MRSNVVSAPLPVVLSAEEARLIGALRGVPDSRLRELTTTLINELLGFAAQPSCAELQADGAPCASADTACDECRKVSSILEGLRRRLHQA